MREEEVNEPCAVWEKWQPNNKWEKQLGPHLFCFVESFKEARAFREVLISEDWEAEAELGRGSLCVEALGTQSTSVNDSPTDECLLEKTSRYSSSIGSLCALVGWVTSSSSPFFKMNGALVAVGEDCDMIVDLGGCSKELVVDPLRVILENGVGKENKGFTVGAEKALRERVSEDERRAIE